MAFERDLGDGWKVALSAGEMDLRFVDPVGVDRLRGWVEDGDFVATDGNPVPSSVLLRFLTIVDEWEKANA